MEKSREAAWTENGFEGDIEAIVPPVIDQEEEDKKPGWWFSCFYYTFWCCLWYPKSNLTQTKSKFISRFKKWLKIKKIK